jgi:hypothetical protein
MLLRKASAKVRREAAPGRFAAELSHLPLLAPRRSRMIMGAPSHRRAAWVRRPLRRPSAARSRRAAAALTLRQFSSTLRNDAGRPAPGVHHGIRRARRYLLPVGTAPGRPDISGSGHPDGRFVPPDRPVSPAGLVVTSTLPTRPARPLRVHDAAGRRRRLRRECTRRRRTTLQDVVFRTLDEAPALGGRRGITGHSPASRVGSGRYCWAATGAADRVRGTAWSAGPQPRCAQHRHAERYALRGRGVAAVPGRPCVAGPRILVPLSAETTL